MGGEPSGEAPGASADSAGVPVPPPLIYLAGFLAGIALEGAFPTGGLPLGVEIAAGVVGVAVWLALDGAAMARFREARTSPAPMRPTRALVTSGPYRYTRNPMYLGMAFLYAGLALALGLLWSLVLLPIILLVIDRMVVSREQRYLERKFGDRYRAYRSRVRRWI